MPESLHAKACEDEWQKVCKNILSLRWDRIIKEYKLQSMLTIVFNNDLVKFFNTVFDADITEEDIARYNLKLMERKYEKLQM